MKKAKTREFYAGKYEVHCSICGAQLGFFDKGDGGDGLTCTRCKRNLSFTVRDGETIVRCKQDRG